MKVLMVLRAVLLIVVFSTSSCALVQKLTCNSGTARSQGQHDAAKGLINQPGLESAKSCEGAEYNPKQYASDYQAGYEEQKNQMCQLNEVAKMAAQDGLSAANKDEAKKKYSTCQKNVNYKSLMSAYEKSYQERFCSDERSQKIAQVDGSSLAQAQNQNVFSGCSNASSLMKTYNLEYQTARKVALKNKEDEFIKNTGTTSFVYNQKSLSSICNINADQSQVTVTVNNPTADKILLQGNWNYQYFDKSFNKLTQDSGQEAVLLTPQSAKSFSKMTLPRDARYCRAEFAGFMN